MKSEYGDWVSKLNEEKDFIDQRIILLRKYEYVLNYFSNIRRQRNPYLTNMRVILAFKMFKDGMIQNDIAIILNRDHSSVSHIFNKEVLQDRIYEEVVENMDQWMQDGVYPSTVGVYVRKKDQRYKTDKWRLTYKLKPI